MKKSVLTIDNFFSGAKELRSHFDDRFRDPRDTDSGRFVWDWWHVPGQYTALRTPAYHYFPAELYRDFHESLVWWGRRNLGCHDISPPWMSCYIDGCKQELHGDLPHGPWAFVFSLTPWKKRKFTGGETMLMREETLSYWTDFQTSRGIERGDVMQEVPALFNRLTVFDPRIPHGVREVEGVRDPRDGRLVIHGWFVQPRPFIEGPLSTKDLQGAIDDLTGYLQELFEQGVDVQGVLSARFKVGASGSVSDFKILTDTLRHPARDKASERAIIQVTKKVLGQVQFKKQKAASHVTLPLIFER